MTGAWDSPMPRHSQLRAVGHSSRMYRMQVRMLTAGELPSDLALYLFHIGFLQCHFGLYSETDCEQQFLFAQNTKTVPGDNEGLCRIEAKPQFSASTDRIACTGPASVSVFGPGSPSDVAPASCRQIQRMRDLFD